MALAIDAVTEGGTTDQNTFAMNHTCAAGAVLFVLLSLWDTDGVTDSVVTSMTYNGVAMTRIRRDEISTGTKEVTEIWYLLNPASGVNSISMNFAGVTNVIDVGAISFTGADTTSQPDAQNGGSQTNATSISKSVTTVADNCYLISVMGNDVSGGASLGAGQTNIMNRSSGYARASYSGPVTPAGSASHSYSNSDATEDWVMSIVSVKPAPTTSIKTVLGLAKASVKTVNGLAIASVKTYEGLQ